MATRICHLLTICKSPEKSSNELHNFTPSATLELHMYIWATRYFINIIYNKQTQLTVNRNRLAVPGSQWQSDTSNRKQEHTWTTCSQYFCLTSHISEHWHRRQY